MERRKATILLATLAAAATLRADAIPQRAQHHPNIWNMLSTYGISREPSNLVPGIKRWLGAHFDRVVSGEAAVPNDQAGYWLGYMDMAGIYSPGLYKVQDVATANGFVLENMFLHWSVDMQVKANQWKDLHQFDGFENSLYPGNSTTAIRGVFTYAGGTYVDVTAKSYSGNASVVIADRLYVGYMEPFDQMNFTVHTARAGGTATYAYWNGSGWAALNPQSDGTQGLSASGQVYFHPPADWMPTAVNGSKSKFWVRVAVSGAGTAPSYTKLHGDNWAVASGTNNARGWDGSVPPCPSNIPNGTPCRINPGTRLEYNANPPANSSAKFRYQGRATGVWASNFVFGNPSDIQNGKRTWAKYLSEEAARLISTLGWEGLMYDNGGLSIDGSALVTRPNAMQYTDYNKSRLWIDEIIAQYGEIREALRAAFGPNVQVGTNTVNAPLGRTGDWSYAESWRYTSYALGTSYAYTPANPYSTHDAFLPVNNPGGAKAAILCWDTADSLRPGVLNFKSWHPWDRGNRTPIGCLAQHYVGSNSNTGFAYYTEGGFIYSDTDEVYTFGPATTITTAVAEDATTRTKTISLASAAGCGAITNGYHSGTAILRLGSKASGDTVYGRITGTTFTTTSAVRNGYSAGDTAHCIQAQHQSLSSPPVENVWKWGPWFPARGVDLGPPDPNGLNGGARMTPWKTGGAPDYLSGQLRAACDAHAGYCADLWRRDFTKAVVLMRPWVNQLTLEAEVDTPSQEIDLGGLYYPLRADGTTGAGISIIRLRANEGAILMKAPVGVNPPSPPICAAGQQQTLRAGHPAQLDGSGSRAQDSGDALGYFWQQLSGPTQVNWQSRSVAQATITGLAFGSYVFQLTVTDSSRQSSSCTVKIGAVATDDNGVVITASGAANSLLGPLLRLGANPWPWPDTLHRKDADLQISAMDTQYPAWWDTPGAGTVAVEAGSDVVTGSGTSFTTTFCRGPEDPATPKPDAFIAVWYNTGVPGQTGRRMQRVSGCADNTHLTMDDAWDTGAIPAGSGLSYSGDDAASHHATNWGWGSTESAGNLNDNVAAYYALYYRSGIDDYLNAARKLADRVWRSPMIDRGASALAGHASRYGYSARSISAPGLLLRALEVQGTGADMWAGLRLIFDSSMESLTSADKSRGPGPEEAHRLAIVAYCALFDPDATYRSNCKTSVSNTFANLWTPALSPDGSWARLFYADSSWDTQTSATLETGSTQVIGNGTSWTSGSFPGTIWFTAAPGSKPANNNAGDAKVYSATYVDASHLILDQPYEGTSGTHGWASVSGTGILGWGAKPAEMGLLASVFDLAARAIDDTYPPEAALGRDYSLRAADWIRTYGYWPQAKGLYFAAQGINCQSPISSGNAACTGGRTTAEARALNADAVRGAMAAYASSGDSRLRDLADTLYNAMFAKPGTCPDNSTVCTPDGEYVSGMDDGGNMMTATPPEGNKWFGAFFGFNNLSAWPAYRVGGLRPETNQTVYVSFNLGGVRGAQKARLTAKAPSGSNIEVECTSSPCAIVIDRRQGKHLIEVKYLSATGLVLARTASPL